MAGAYDDREGFIWMDGKLVPWREANVHILSHAMHYASSVFEGERCYDGKIFKGHEHSLRLLESGRLLDMPIPYTAEQIDAAKAEVLAANNLTNAYVRAVAWRGAGEDMGVAARRNPVRLAVAAWEWVPITATPRCRARSWTSPNGAAPRPTRSRQPPRPRACI